MYRVLLLFVVGFLATFGYVTWIRSTAPQAPPPAASPAGPDAIAAATKPDASASPTAAATSVDESSKRIVLKPAAESKPAAVVSNASSSDEAPPIPAPAGMVWIPGGEFTMGSDDPDAKPDEQPPHKVRVGGFFMDVTEVTNAQFRAFTQATGYVTMAEKAPTLEEIMKQVPPGTPPPPKEALVPGSLVFTPTEGPVALDDFTQWWRWQPGADWKHPDGPKSNIEGRDNHPVVHVSYDDVLVYCKWAGKRLPTEAEWEYAARGGLQGKPYVWGDDPINDAIVRANIFQGGFPYRNTNTDGFTATAPVKTFKPNGYGLYDMSGNVWEICSDWYRPDTYQQQAKASVVDNPAGPSTSYDPREPYAPKRVVRGGSFLCNACYCKGYRVSARMSTSVDSGLNHTGFRCVMSPEQARAAQAAK